MSSHTLHDESEECLLPKEAESIPLDDYTVGFKAKRELVASILTKIDIRARFRYDDDSGEPRSRRAVALAWFTRHAHVCLALMVPSFLTKQERKPLNAVAALDGLRGYASLGVFTLHFTDTFCQEHNRGWGFTATDRYLFQLPFVHFFWTAGSLVACFFVISGYVLSYKPLCLIHAHDFDAFLVHTRSSIFRRGIRLYLPAISASFIALVLLRLGLFDYPHLVFTGGWTRGSEDIPIKLPTIWAQILDWWNCVGQMTYLFKFSGWGPHYDPHLHTIPTEFAGSMLLFITTIGVSRLHTALRVGSIALMILYCVYFNASEMLLFFLGMLLCDFDLLLRAVPTKPVGSVSPTPDHRIKRLRFFWLVCFAIGLYLAGTPSWDTAGTPGYKAMMSLMNNWFWWETIGCGLLVWSVRNSHDLQPLFTNAFAQYLGNISFAMYIVHGNVRRSLTYALVPATLWITGSTEHREGTGFAVAVLLNAIVTYSVVFWLADMWWRGVDLPAIRFARWLEEKTCVKV